MTNNKLPIEIEGDNLDMLCVETARLFAKYGIDFKQDEELLLDLSETISDFLEEKCQVIIKGNVSDLSWLIKQ